MIVEDLPLSAVREAFVKVLVIAGESGFVKKVGGISVDGTKIKANVSKHAAVSHDRAGKLIEQLTLEVAELERKAEEADSGSGVFRWGGRIAAKA